VYVLGIPLFIIYSIIIPVTILYKMKKVKITSKDMKVGVFFTMNSNPTSISGSLLKQHKEFS